MPRVDLEYDFKQTQIYEEAFAEYKMGLHRCSDCNEHFDAEADLVGGICTMCRAMANQATPVEGG